MTFVTGHDETISEDSPYEIFDPEYTWKRKRLTNFEAKPLLVPIFEKGRRVYDSPALGEIRARCADGVATLWEAVLRFENPHKYYVDLSASIWQTRERLLKEMSCG